MKTNDYEKIFLKLDEEGERIRERHEKATGTKLPGIDVEELSQEAGREADGEGGVDFPSI